MKSKNAKSQNWLSNFGNLVLDSVTWGKLIYIAVLLATSMFVYLLVREK